MATKMSYANYIKASFMLIQCIERKCSFWHNLGNALGQNYGPESDRAEESA